MNSRAKINVPHGHWSGCVWPKERADCLASAKTSAGKEPKLQLLQYCNEGRPLQQYHWWGRVEMPTVQGHKRYPGWKLLQKVSSSFAKVAPYNSVLVKGISSEGRCRWCWYPQDNTAGDMHRWLREVYAAQSCCRCPLCLVVGELLCRLMNPFAGTKWMLVCINDGIMIVFCILVLLCSITTVFYQDRRSGFLGWWTPPTHRLKGKRKIVPQRNAATLLPIIQQHVAPGTIIHSDEWRTYSQVSTLPNVAAHATVNHSLEFVNSITGVHTENVESYWNRSKIKLKRMRGCHELELSSYLDEFMLRERFGTSRQAFENIILHISTQYPVS